MTTAQDQQSRAEFEAWASNGGAHQRAITRSGDGYLLSITQSFWHAWQAARALPAPENVREGEPYDNPAFEDLARTMGVWGTAQAALCAQFFLAGRGAPAAGDGALLPIAAKSHGAWDGLEELLGLPDGTEVYTAAQVQAMGRVPPGWQAVPVEPTGDMLAALSGEWHSSRHRPDRYAAMLAAAPRPPAAQECKTVACACGDEFPIDSYGGGFLDAKGKCFGCDAADEAAHGITGGGNAG